MGVFKNILKDNFPRVLTQVCRDPGSKAYGSFDRNWWHYKIRDFSSVILQQGGYFLNHYRLLDEYTIYDQEISKIVRGSIQFWIKRSNKKGAFEEYYPWESGYPPLAFSTLSIVKLMREYDFSGREYLSAVKNSANQLANRFEHQAGNQQVAGLSALSLIQNMWPDLVNDRSLEEITIKTLSLQAEEGWFMEYGGSDLGYLSVTIDCLWDLYDLTKNKIYLDSIENAFQFMAKFVLFAGGSIGMHNSRNTDYIVPYGIARILTGDNPELKEKAKSVFEILYSDVDSGSHFLRAVDDRYWIHYIGHSVIRAELLLRKNNIQLKNNRNKTLNQLDSNVKSFSSSHYAIQNKKYKILISANKGGLFTVWHNNHSFADYGWIIKENKLIYITNWLNDDWQKIFENSEFVINGFFVPKKEVLSNPIMHIGLRIISYFLGNRIIRLLKERLIFGKKSQKFSFKRTIQISDDQAVIRDEISGLTGKEEIFPAPRSSKRHVSSSDSFHYEDFSLNSGIEIKEELKQDIPLFWSKKTIKF